MKFLEDKSEDLNLRIKNAEVGGRSFLTKRRGGMAQSRLVVPKTVVTETSQGLPKLQDGGFLG